MRRGNAGVAVGYIRTSTSEQRLSPEAQEAALRAWAEREGAELVVIERDVASGRSRLDRRPGLTRALAALRQHRAGRLVALRRDRFARDVALAAQLGLLVRRAGAELVVVDGPPPGDSPEAVLMRQLVDAVAEFEAGVIRERTRAALRAKLARGEAAGGTAPYGKRIVRGRLVDDPAELAALARAQELRAQQMSLREVSIRLRVEGHRPRGTAWHVSTLARLLADGAG
ncbi:recombinase family protein [Nannocystis exedens]|uniref:recombinase family protein n=1 Tax=Nannocystis exedens TaxID=54 RepID=UPI000BC60469|nr:recombinase family protein [Nannocystis exedens]PCC66461.1 hypothetical protein NAEX_09049 [Nannocystis exedens]